MRALVGILTYPPLCIICGLLLFFDWCSLPNTMTSRSVAAQYCPFNPTHRGAVHSRRLPVQLFRTPAGLRAAVLGSGSTPSDWDPVYEFYPARLPIRESGFWAMTSLTEGLAFYGDESLTPAERAQLFPALLAALDSTPGGSTVDPIAYALLKTSVTSRSQTLYSGYIHNTIAVALALLFLAGLPRLLVSSARSITHLPHGLREDRRLARGLCPTCAYDLQADFESGCPECGWNRREEQNERGAP